MIERLMKTREAASIKELEVLLRSNFTKENLRDVSNARRFATHDVELLLGHATSRVDYTAELEQLQRGVVWAFTEALSVLVRAGVTEAIRDEFSELFTRQLREARTQVDRVALEAGDEVPGEVVGEEEAA